MHSSMHTTLLCILHSIFLVLSSPKSPSAPEQASFRVATVIKNRHDIIRISGSFVICDTQWLIDGCGGGRGEEATASSIASDAKGD